MPGEGDLDGLREYIKLTQGMELSESEKDQIANFIDRLLGNQQINEMISKDQNLMSLDSQAVSDALDMTFHTRLLNEFYIFLTTAKVGYEKLMRKEKLNEHEKLSLRQFAILGEIAALTPIFQRLEYFDIPSRNANVKEFHETIHQCNKIVTDLTEKIKAETQRKLGLFLFEKRNDGYSESLKYFSSLVKLYVKSDLTDLRPTQMPAQNKRGKQE